MRNLAFHILLFTTVVVFVVLFLYSERIFQEGFGSGSSQQADMNSLPASTELSSKQVQQLRINLVNGVYYVVMDALMFQSSLYNKDTSLSFCSQTGFIAVNGCPPAGSVNQECVKAVGENLSGVVDKTLPNIPENILFDNSFNRYQRDFFADCKAEYLKALTNAYPSAQSQWGQTTDMCMFFDTVLKETADVVNSAKFYPTDTFRNVLTRIVKKVDVSSLQTVGDIRDYVIAVKTAIQENFVAVWFPTGYPYPKTNGGLMDVYGEYAKRLNKTISSSIDRLFSGVNMTNYLDKKLPQSVAVGQPVPGVVQQGDPGTIFQFQLSSSYGTDPKEHCKSGKFHSVVDPSAKNGDLIHFMCD
jgi:hypothetical protein